MDLIAVANKLRLTCEGHAALVEAIARQVDPDKYTNQLIRFVPQLREEILRAYSFVLENPDGNLHFLAYVACSI